MKALKIAKFHIHGTLMAVKIYYAIFISVVTLLAIESVKSGGNIHSTGLEFSTVIFLFIAGLNSFKSNFKFSQANNVTRISFFKGLVIGVFPITFFMSIIDIIINRIYNIFVKSPTNYDMIYGVYKQIDIKDKISIWSQSNDIFTLIGTFTWQFVVYSMILLLGVLISLIYYRSNNYLRVIVSIVPWLILMIFFNITPDSIKNQIATFISFLMGYESQNPSIAIVTFGALGAICAGFIYLLIRRAELKE